MLSQTKADPVLAGSVVIDLVAASHSPFTGEGATETCRLRGGLERGATGKWFSRFRRGWWRLPRLSQRRGSDASSAPLNGPLLRECASGRMRSRGEKDHQQK